MTTRPLRSLAGALALPLVLLGLAGGSARAQTETIRVACSSADAFAEAIYADEAGFFKRAGLDVQLVNLPNSGAIAAAVAGGSIDVGLANPIAIANAHEQGLGFEIIAPSALYRADHATTVLVVPAASPLRTAKDLEGKTIATIEVRGIMEAGIRSWMSKSGADPSGVRFIEMGFSAMPAALAQGRVDAAFIAEPVLTTTRSATREIGNPYAALASVWYSNVWFAPRDWLDRNPALAHRFVRTIEQAAAWENAHHAETGAILLRYTKLPPEILARMTRTDYGDRLDPGRIQPVLDTAVRYGAIKDLVSAKDLIAPGF